MVEHRIRLCGNRGQSMVACQCKHALVRALQIVECFLPAVLFYVHPAFQQVKKALLGIAAQADAFTLLQTKQPVLLQFVVILLENSADQFVVTG